MTNGFTMRSSPAADNRGVTLVELLVAITIGLLLTIVIAQLFLGSRQTFATTDDVSRMHDNIRYTQQLLTRTIHLTSYKSQANSVTANVFSLAAALGGTNASGPISNGQAGTESDSVTVRYQGSGDKSSPASCKSATPPVCPGADGLAVDCLGVAIDAGMMAENTFSIAPGANGRNALYCNNGVNNVEIVSDVENMQIRFGEDLDGDLVADRFLAPGASGMNLDKVVSVQIALLFQTPSVTAKVAPDAQTYDMFDDLSVVLGPFNDRRIRRLVTTTVNLRNRTP